MTTSNEPTSSDKTGNEPITRDTLETAFSELRDDVDGAAPTLLARAAPAVVAAVVVVVCVAYLLGRRAGRLRSTVVEVRRI